MRIGGLKVVDATKPVSIKINAKDVKDGGVKNAAACAAALACKRLFNSADARVHVSKTYVKVNNKWIRFRTPQSLRAEIVAFDRGGRFAPGEYTLGKVEPANRLGARKKPPGGHNPKPKRRIAKRHMTVDVRQHGANR